jgi:UDP-GlcNAc:undecaprenyl-phosphate GlcNAc-1-phosphate transferase
MEMMHLLYIFFIALVSSMVMIPFLMRLTLATGTVDKPDAREVRNKAFPRISGVAICMGWLFSLLIYVDLTLKIRGILAGTLLIFFTGLIDDLYGLSPKKKFLGQIAACLITICVGHLSISSLGNLFGGDTILLPPWMGIPLTILVVVGIVNSFDLMDGLDGLAGGISLIALTAFLILGHLSKNFIIMALCTALLGAILGFLKHNQFPVRVFMGHTGSLVAGFITAFLAIMITQTSGSKATEIVPALILGIPIAETLRITVLRIFQKTSPSFSDKTQPHHNFLELGLKHRHTFPLIYGLSIFWATFLLLARNWEDWRLMIYFALLMSLLYLDMLLLRRFHPGIPFPRGVSSVPIRQSAPSRSLAQLVESTTPVAIFLILSYLILATFSCSETDLLTLRAGTALLLGCATLIIFTKDMGNHFVLALTAAAVLLTTVLVNNNGSREMISGLTLPEVSNILLSCISALVLLRLIFHNPKERLLNSIDYLIVGLGTFVILVSTQVDIGKELPVTMAKGIILFLALKVSTSGGPKPAQLFVGGILAALLCIIIKGYFF